MPKFTAFEKQYPTIHRFVEEIGWIEIGQHEMIPAFVRAYDLVALTRTIITQTQDPRSLYIERSLSDGSR